MTQPTLIPYPLSDEQEQRAARLHDECIIIDGMNQHPGGPNIFKELPQEWVAEQLAGLSAWEALGKAMFLPYLADAEGVSSVIRDWWKVSGVNVGNGEAATNRASMEGLEGTHEILARLDWITMVTTAGEIRQNKADDIISLWGYDQPVYGIPNKLSAIEEAYERGLRTLMMTYNRMDYVGTGCTERYDAGLSMYGLDVVSKCNELGIIVDTSHCGDQTTLDACEYSKQPVIANHSSAYGVFAHARGKKDHVIERIAETGGLVGVVTVPFFTSADPQPSVDVVCDHIDYIKNLVGIDHVGLGTDWPMQMPSAIAEEALGGMISEIGFRPEDKVSPTATFEGFDDYRGMLNITRGLVSRGYSDQDIAKVLGENYLRVIEQVCG